MNESDSQLLRAYVTRDDRLALAALVRRYIGFVHSAARRQVGDAHLAEDVTQAVFILLARKAHTIRGEAALASWLFGVTRYAANNARKLAARRRYYERQAAQFFGEIRSSEDAGVDEQLIATLDEAIAALPQRDRAGIILSYFQNKSHRQVGEAIGVSEDAARKRVSRAVDRLREFFVSRGVGATSAAVGSVMLSEAAHGTPPLLTESTINLVSLSSAPIGVAGMIAKGVNHMWMIAKMKTAAALAGATLACGLVTAHVVDRSSPAETRAVYLSAAAVEDKFESKLESGATVHFLGLCKVIDGAWFDLAGRKIADPTGPFADDEFPDQHQYHAALYVNNADQPALNAKVNGRDGVLVYNLDDGPKAQIVLLRFTLPDGEVLKKIEFLVGDGEWMTIGKTEVEPDRPARPLAIEQGGFAFTHVSEFNGGAQVYVATDYKGDEAMSVFAVDSNGNDHFCQNVWDSRVNTMTATRYHYAMPPEQVVALAVKVRPFNHKLTVENFAIVTGQNAVPKIEYQKLESK